MNCFGAPRLATERAVFPIRSGALMPIGAHRESFMSDFWANYRDPRWQKKRLEIMEAWEFKCSMCDAADKPLNVHHKIYRKGAAPWEYSSRDLECLCENCHEKTHARMTEIKECLARMEDWDLNRVLGYLQGLIAFGDEPEGEAVQVIDGEHAQGISDAISPVSEGREEIIGLAMAGKGKVSVLELNQLWRIRWDRLRK